MFFFNSKNKVEYLIRSLKNVFSNKQCPYCKSNSYIVIDRKYIVTTLNNCKKCNLNYRHPVDTIEFNSEFYQEDYVQKDGITTDLPNYLELEAYKNNNFKNTSKDYTPKIELLKKLVDKEKISLIDFGANWGYTSFQFKNAGFETQSYEISSTRAEFGKNIGIDIYTDTRKLKANNDVFFNAHVIEHLPDIKTMFELAKDLLNKDGLFVCYCPNGSDKYREINPKSYHTSWGEVHPNLLSDSFFREVFKDAPFLIGSNNSKELDILRWDGKTQTVLDLTGTELFVFSKIKEQVF